MTRLNGLAKVLRDNKIMPEVFRDLPGYVNELTDDIIRLAQAGRVEEVRAVIGRLLSHGEADEEPQEYLPGQATMTFRGIVGEIRIGVPGDGAPVQITTTSADFENAPGDFTALVKTINESIRLDKNFLDGNGRPTPAQKMNVDDLVREVGRIITSRMHGWVRTERPASVRLD